MADPVWVNVDESAVRSFIRTGGAVADQLDDVARGVKTFSIEYISTGQGKTPGRATHIRSGRLLRSLWINKTKAEGPLTGVARAGSNARHVLYFHNGTPSIISHPNMVVPKRPGVAHTNLSFAGAGSQKLHENAEKKRGKGVKRRDWVRGQHAKPFLEEGLTAALVAERLAAR